MGRFFFTVVAVIGFVLPGLASDSPVVKIQGKGHLQIATERTFGEDQVRGRALDPGGAPLPHQVISVSSLGVKGNWLVATDANGNFSLAVSTDPERLGWSANFSGTGMLSGASVQALYHRKLSAWVESTGVKEWTLKGRVLEPIPGESKGTWTFPGEISHESSLGQDGGFSWRGLPVWLPPNEPLKVTARVGSVSQTLLLKETCEPQWIHVRRVESGVTAGIRCLPTASRHLFLEGREHPLEVSSMGNLFLPLPDDASAGTIRWHWLPWEDEDSTVVPFEASYPGGKQALSPIWGLLLLLPLLVGGLQAIASIPSGTGRRKGVRPFPAPVRNRVHKGELPQAFNVVDAITGKVLAQSTVLREDGSELSRMAGGAWQFTDKEGPITLKAPGYRSVEVIQVRSSSLPLMTPRQEVLKSILKEPECRGLSLKDAVRVPPAKWPNLSTAYAKQVDERLFGDSVEVQP